MTYTVKNGTWCKNNEGSYFSCDETGFKAALKRQEIASGTRVVIHERRQPAATIIQSLNPECPEGFFVPDGSEFDAEVYSDLAKIFTDGKLPDLRECVLVMTGKSDRTEIINHDEYSAGQFKDDQFAKHSHIATSEVTDPGHNHGITDPGHKHDLGFEERNQDGTGHRCDNFSNKPKQTETEPAYTGISINKETTGISVETTLSDTGAADKVTHGKQIGVYYYISY